jgi:hypothetical protein
MVPDSRAGDQSLRIESRLAFPAGHDISVTDSRELVRASGNLDSALVVVGTDHRLADPESLKAMLEACERSFNNRKRGDRKE